MAGLDLSRFDATQIAHSSGLSSAKGLFQPKAERLRRGLQNPLMYSKMAISASRSPGPLPQKLRDLTFEIGLDGWLLGIAPILSYPAAKCRKADPKIGGHLFTRQPAGQRYAHSLRAKLWGGLRCHDVSPLWQNTKSKERNIFMTV